MYKSTHSTLCTHVSLSYLSCVMATSLVTCHECRMSMLQRLLARIRPSPGSINNQRTLLNASSTHLITFTCSEIILETGRMLSHRKLAKYGFGEWRNYSELKNVQSFLQRFVLNKYFTVKDLLWLFSSIGLLQQDKSGNIGCNSSEKYPDIFCFWMGPLFSASSGS